MCAAETTVGFRGRTVHAVPLDLLRTIGGAGAA